jgi:VCBS repeat-containing protein
LTSTQAIAVMVDNVNEAPVITSDGSGASAAISVAENATAVTTVTATDADAATTLTYSISGGADAAKFTIDASSGALSFVAAPDFETPADAGADNVYDVIVQVSDGTLTDTQAIAVTVTPVSDNAPVITSNAGAATASVNVAENTTAVGIVTATDADLPAQTLTYSIVGGADAGRFTINAATGVLSFVTAPDYEAPTDAGADNVYDVTVQVSDGTLTDSQAIAVAVTAVNDNAPVITSTGGGASASVSVAENTTAVTTVTASDADLPSQTLTYSIAGGADAARFTIDSASGALRFVATPDFEAPSDSGADNTYDVIVQASDGTLASTQAIAVTVLDVNEAPQAADHLATVAEGAALAIDLAAGAADVDAGANGSIDLSSAVIGAGPTHGSLVLNANGTATYSHDGSETTSDSFSYTLRDAAGATSNVATVRLTVTPVNDAPTVSAATLPLRAGQGLVLDTTQLQASDPDNTAASLSFAVSNVSNGRFEWVATPGAAISQFTQADVAAGRVRFMSTSGTDAPTFRVMAFDGQLYSAEVSAAIVFTRDAVLPAEDTTAVPPKVLPGVAGPVDATVLSSLPVAAPAAAHPAELPAPGHEVDLSDAPPVRFEPAAPRQGRAAVAAEPVRSHTSGSDLDLSVGIADDYAIRALQLQVLDAAQSARPSLHAGPQDEASSAVQTTDEESSTGLTLVEAAQITGVALTAGTVWWALRAGGLLAGLMVSLPAWRHADLLAVLPDDEEDDHWDLAEDDEAARDEQAVAQVFEPAFEGDLR